MKITKNYSIQLILSISLLASCQKGPADATKQNPEVPQVQTNDANLIKKYKKPFADFLFARQNFIWSESLDEKSINNYIKLSTVIQDEILLNKSKKYQKKYESDNASSNIPMNQAIYFKLIHQQSDQALSEGLNTAEKDVLDSLNKVKQIVISNRNLLEPINTNMNLNQQIDIAENYINIIVGKISETKLNLDLQTKVLDQLKAQSQLELSKPRDLSKQLLASKKLSTTIDVLKMYIANNQVQLQPANQVSIAQATQLGQLIDETTDEKKALQALAMAWSMLTAEERIKNFKTANKKLYDFFEKKSDDEIQCLIQNTCNGFFKKLVLKFGVYPAIKDYGIDKIQITLNENSLATVSIAVQTQAAATITTLDENINLQIETQVQDNLKQLNQFKNEFVNTIASGLNEKLRLDTIPLFNSNNTLDFQREFINATNQALLLNQYDEPTQFLLVEKMLQFMNLGVNAQKSSFLDAIKENLQKADPRFYIQVNKNTDAKLNVRDQAASIIFYSKMLNLLSDWKNTPYDQGITKYKAQDFITQFQSQELERNLFQKSELVGMALSLAGQTLKQIETEQSVIFLLDANNQRVSIKDYLNNTDSNNGSPLVHAAASDLKNGKLVDYTNLIDLCYLIQAYSEYYFATENINLSKSESLKDQELLKQVTNSRNQMKLVILTLANFISNQMINKDKTLNSSLNFQTQEKMASHLSTDYALAVNALMTAYTVTKIDIYKMAAEELYYVLNNQFYSEKSRFYKNDSNIPNTSNKINQEYLVQMFVNLHSVRSVLDLTSQMQFDRIFENWISQL